ncbi:MAG: CDP-glycerol glycerophosphotransferase family protein, partial [Nocardioides sp.]|nr:CDP-glycerol glycerophosphotransferase family protein [Nocardioides sp.]
EEPMARATTRVRTTARAAALGALVLALAAGCGAAGDQGDAGAPPADEPLPRRVLAGGGTQREVQVEEITASRPQVRAWTFSCPLPTGDVDRSLLADLGPADAVRVLMTRPPARDVDAEWTWTAGARAGALLAASPTPPRVTSLHRDRDRLVVDIHAVDVSALENLRLENPSTVVPAFDIEPLGAHSFRATFSLRSRSFGGPELPLPTGDLTLRAGRGIEPKAETTLLTKLPMRVRCAELRLAIASPPRRAVVVEVTAPLDTHEVSFAGQYALQRAYQGSDAVLSDSVLFQCYRGEFATDSQAALDEGLRAFRPELTRYWGVSDFSVQVPEGSVPLLIGSREWYDALATSRFLCNNIDFDPFFRKRPGQRYLQTFHGYPFKSMGRGFWHGKGHSEERISREQARRNEEYDAILVPSERAADFYRSEYAFTGTIMVTGYPRSDVLLNADRDRVRTRVLDRLGVGVGQKVVLYAPTYRDHLTTRVYAAKRFDELDLTALTRGLGPDYTVLVRGHNNNQREADRTHDVAQVLDVTDYPEINDLTIAADAAILDYSSLRFDWALTGKPMVFFVPDLDTYFAQRPPLFPFDESAPGPLLRSTEEVADKLLDLPRLLAGQQADIAAFNAEFNQLHDGHATERVIEAFFSD